MRQFLLILASALSCVLLLAGNTPAKGKGVSGTYQGTITSVQKNAITINVAGGGSKLMRITVDAKTSVTGGGKTGSISDLYSGLIVTVKVSNNRASSIEVTGVANSD